MTTENQIKSNALARVLSDFRKAEILEKSGLDLDEIKRITAAVHVRSFAAGLRIEIISTPDMAHKDYRTTTLRVMHENVCVHSETLK